MYARVCVHLCAHVTVYAALHSFAGEGVPHLPQIKQLRKFAQRRFELKPAELQAYDDLDDGPVVVSVSDAPPAVGLPADRSDADRTHLGGDTEMDEMDLKPKALAQADESVPERMEWMLPPPGCS